MVHIGRGKETMSEQQIISQVMDLLTNDVNPMCSTDYLGRKLFGWGFDSHHDYYGKLCRTLNKLEAQNHVYKCGTKNGGNVWMLQRRDVRISNPFTYSTDLLGELPF